MANLSIPRTSGIYVMSNTKSGKVYIGQSQDLKERWLGHKSSLRRNVHRNGYLQNAWNKYGAKVFKFSVLEYCPIEKLDEREQYWLDIYIPKGICYNIAIDAFGTNRGRKFSEEHVRKMRESRLRNAIPLSDESRQRMSDAHKGKSIPEEQRRKLSEAGKRKPPVSEETKRKLSEAAIRQHARNKTNKESNG